MSAVVAAFLPVGLILMMLVVGLRLSLRDIVRTFRQPRGLMVGLMVQVLGLPGLAIGLASLMGLSATMAAGLALVAVAPGGITSNYVSLLARADIALSAAMTLVTTCLSVATIPLILWGTGVLDTPGGAALGPIGLAMAAVALAPIALGGLMQRLMPAVAHRASRLLEPVSKLVFLLVVAATFAQNWEAMLANLQAVGLACVALNLGALGLAALAARAARLGAGQARAVSIEASLQNVAVTLFLAESLLQQPGLAVPGVIYAAVMNVTALGHIALGRRQGRAAQTA